MDGINCNGYFITKCESSLSKQMAKLLQIVERMACLSAIISTVFAHTHTYTIVLYNDNTKRYKTFIIIIIIIIICSIKRRKTIDRSQEQLQTETF